MGIESKIKVDPKTRAKSILLVYLSSLLESVNLDYVNFKKVKPDKKFLKRYFLFGAILLILTKLIPKPKSCIIEYRVFKIVKWLTYKKS